MSLFAARPFSLFRDHIYDREEAVTFVVVPEQAPLLKEFSAAQIGQQTEAVVQRTALPEAEIARVQALARAALGSDDGFGFTYTMATVGFAVTTVFGNLEVLEDLQGVQSVYVAPVFSVPESKREQLSALTAQWSEDKGPAPTGDRGFPYVLVAMAAMTLSASVLFVIKRKEQW